MEIIEDSKYLKSESDIIPYFKDNGVDFLPCGQGYFTADAEVITKIGEKYFKVIIEGEIVGDKLYHVEEITNVEYSEVKFEDVRVESNIKQNTFIFINI